MWDEGDLEFVEDPIPEFTVVNCLRGIGKKHIMYENASPLRKRELLSDDQVKYIQDIIVARDRDNRGMGRKEVI